MLIKNRFMQFTTRIAGHKKFGILRRRNILGLETQIFTRRVTSNL
jgi:hypothetical protein